MNDHRITRYALKRLKEGELFYLFDSRRVVGKLHPPGQNQTYYLLL